LKTARPSSSIKNEGRADLYLYFYEADSSLAARARRNISAPPAIHRRATDSATGALEEPGDLRKILIDAGAGTA
jgi:hypothetical protein